MFYSIEPIGNYKPRTDVTFRTIGTCFFPRSFCSLVFGTRSKKIDLIIREEFDKHFLDKIIRGEILSPSSPPGKFSSRWPMIYKGRVLPIDHCSFALSLSLNRHRSIFLVSERDFLFFFLRDRRFFSIQSKSLWNNRIILLLRMILLEFYRWIRV